MARMSSSAAGRRLESLDGRADRRDVLVVAHDCGEPDAALLNPRACVVDLAEARAARVEPQRERLRDGGGERRLGVRVADEGPAAAPRAGCTSCEAARSFIVSRIVPLLTPNSSASSTSLGRRWPAARSPLRMLSRIWSAICCAALAVRMGRGSKGTAAPGSTTHPSHGCPTISTAGRGRSGPNAQMLGFSVRVGSSFSSPTVRGVPAPRHRRRLPARCRRWTCHTRTTRAWSRRQRPRMTPYTSSRVPGG